MRRKGSALIEFLLGLAVLAPALVSGIQFVDAWARLGQLQEAAVRGARIGSRLPYSEADPAAFRRSVEDAVLSGSAVPGLTRDQIRVSMEFESGRPYTVRVSVNGYKLRTPGSTTLLDGRPSVSYPYRGPWLRSSKPGA